MGLISVGLLKLEHLEKVLQFYDEVFETFKPKYFHMGGDETRGATSEYFQKIVNLVCNWGKNKGIQIIAWEDILNKVDPPDNLIIHKWKQRTYPNIMKKLELIGERRIIYSNDYYLDRCFDPLTIFRKKCNINSLGHIICTWSELIGEENIEHTLFPTIYLIGYKFANPETKLKPIEVLNIFNQNNQITLGLQNTWKRRQWLSFVKNNSEIPKRSCSYKTKDIKLNQEDDQYPIISNFLILMLNDFDKMINNQILPSEENITNYNKAFKECMNNNDYNLIDKIWLNYNNKEKLLKTLRVIRHKIEDEEQELYKNGLRMIVREILRYSF